MKTNPVKVWKSLEALATPSAVLRAGSRVRVYSSRNAWTPAAVSGSFLPRMRFTSPTQVSESSSVTARSKLLGFSMA